MPACLLMASEARPVLSEAADDVGPLKFSICGRTMSAEKDSDFREFLRNFGFSLQPDVSDEEPSLTKTIKDNFKRHYGKWRET